MATTATGIERPSVLLDRALAAATNDDAVELYYKLINELAGRVEKAVDIAIDSDDRDAENEALVFANEVDAMFPFMSGLSDGPIREAAFKVDDARGDIKVAIRNRRLVEGGRGMSKVESFSRRRNARITSAWQAARRHEERLEAKTVERANVTDKRVLEAISRLDPGQFQARDVAIALLPALTDTSIPGRQLVITRVGAVMRKLVNAGKLEQHRPEKEGRGTCRYTVVENA